MKLKLFRSTEFAESSLFVPFKQRMSAHPAWIALLASLWLATASNAPLWRELARICEQGQIGFAWPAARMAVLMTMVCFLIFCILSSRRLLKPLITLAFFVAAINCHVMFTEHLVIDQGLISRSLANNPLSILSFLSWQLWGTVLILAILPTVLLWRTPVRRLSPVHYLLQNGGFAVAGCVVIFGTLVLSSPDLSELVRANPQLRQMANPFGLLQSAMEVARLRAPA